MGWRKITFTIGAALLLPSTWLSGVRAGNTTCASGQLDWYTSVVGETPCMTYQRLRQICNSDYQVPDFRSSPPGDNCNDQVSACCCNTVAFQLSMLCMNCQYDEVAGNAVGIDAAKGTYGLYKATCGAGTNNSLPANVQTAVCNQDIRLDDFLYGGWSDGSWFYVWTRENAQLNHATNNNNTFTHCPNQISPSATPKPTSTSTTSTVGPTPLAASVTSNVQSQTSSSSSVGSVQTEQPTQTNASSQTSESSSQTNALAQTNEPTQSAEPAPASQSAQSASSQQNEDDSSNDASGANSSSNTGAIIGAVLGVVGALILVGSGIMYFRVRKRKALDGQDGPYQYMFNDDDRPGPPMASVTQFTPTQFTPFAPSRGPPSQGQPSQPALSPLRYGGVSSSVGSHGPGSEVSSVGPSAFEFIGAAMVANENDDDGIRHADGGPVAGLVRSNSGRLPPAYRSWEEPTVDRNSLAYAHSETSQPTGSQMSGSQVSGSQVSDRSTHSTMRVANPDVPMVPIRRSSISKAPLPQWSN